MTCDGCLTEIAEGEHFIELEVRTGTVMPIGYRPARDVPNRNIATIRLHNPLSNPSCFAMWAGDDELVLDVFAR